MQVFKLETPVHSYIILAKCFALKVEFAAHACRNDHTTDHCDTYFKCLPPLVF